MAGEEIVRKPLRVRKSSSRSVDQRLLLRFPRLTDGIFRLIGRLSPRSRLRQAVMWRAVRQGLEAYNRRDLEVTAAAFHPDLEYYPYREFVEGGLAEPVYRGRAGYRAYIEGTSDVWGTEVRLEPTELIDMGDRLVMLANMPMRAQASGVTLAETYGSVWTLREGRVVKVQDFLLRSEALETAGLS